MAFSDVFSGRAIKVGLFALVLLAVVYVGFTIVIPIVLAHPTVAQYMPAHLHSRDSTLSVHCNCTQVIQQFRCSNSSSNGTTQLQPDSENYDVISVKLPVCAECTKTSARCSDPADIDIAAVAERVHIGVLTQAGSVTAIPIRDTWAKHVRHLTFFSNAPDPELQPVVLANQGIPPNLHLKVLEMFKYVYDNHPHADWIIKADDDMFMIAENLYRFLATQPVDKPVYFGAQYQYPPDGPAHIIYCSGGSGYGLNRKAVELLLATMCANLFGFEDVTIGGCLAKHGVAVTNAVGMYGDTAGEYLTRQKHNNRFPNHMKWETSMAEYPISFHHLKAEHQIWEYDFLVYGRKVNVFK